MAKRNHIAAALFPEKLHPGGQVMVFSTIQGVFPCGGEE
jgi:hypothetical protein